MPSNRNGQSEDVLGLLSRHRQREILDEALRTQILGILNRHARSSLGALVDALRADPRWKLLKDLRVSTVLQPASPSARPAAPRTARGRRRGLSPALLERIVAVIQKRPGLRSEQIQQQMDADRRLVKAGLAKLRALKRVKTSGDRRATTYSAA